MSSPFHAFDSPGVKERLPGFRCGSFTSFKSGLSLTFHAEGADVETRKVSVFVSDGASEDGPPDFQWHATRKTEVWDFATRVLDLVRRADTIADRTRRYMPSAPGKVRIVIVADDTVALQASVWVDVPNQALVFFIQETHSSMWHLFLESVPSADREYSVIQIGTPRRSTGLAVDSCSEL